MKRRAFVVVALLTLASAGCKRNKNPNALEGGEIKYAMSGFEKGKVVYAAGVRPEDARAIGEWLKDKGWFLTNPDNKSAVTGKALGSWGTGAAGRGMGAAPLAKVAPRNQAQGLEVIVYASQQDAESTDVMAFGSLSADELKKKVGRPVRFVVRSETKKGEGVSWVDTYFDSEESQARSNGK